MPNLVQEPSSQGKFVLRQLWQSFVEDMFDVENAMQTKAEFCYCHRSDGRDRRLGGRKLGRIQIRGKHVDIYESSDMQWAKPHAELQALQIQVHDGSRELGVRRCS